MSDRISVYGPAMRALEETVGDAIERFWSLYQLVDKAPVEWAGLIGALEALFGLLDPQPMEVPRAEDREPSAGRGVWIDGELAVADDGDLDAALDELAVALTDQPLAAVEAANAGGAAMRAAAAGAAIEAEYDPPASLAAEPAVHGGLCPWGCGRRIAARALSGHWCGFRRDLNAPAEVAVAPALRAPREEVYTLTLCDWCQRGFVDLGAHRAVCEAKPAGGPDCVHRWRLDSPVGLGVRQECVHCGVEKTVSADPESRFARAMDAKREQASGRGRWCCPCGAELRGPAISAHKRECQAWRVPAVAP